MADSQDESLARGVIAVLEEAGVLRLTITNPSKKNAISKAMYRSLAKALEEAVASDSVRVVVIQGAGGVFTSGNDVGDFGGTQAGEVPAPAQFLNALVSFPKPIIAQVEGLAIGIGTTMLLHCDLVYAATDARFQLPFVNLGLVPEAASSFLLPRLLGSARAAELIFFGEMFSADRALEFGIVNSLHTPEALAAHVQVRAEALAAKAPKALRSSKALLRGLPEGGVKGRMAEESRLFAEAIEGREFAEALSAFRERRKPDFSSF